MPVRDATPEDLIRSTKGVTLATAKVVAAGNSCQQDDIITAANMGRNAITEMLIICKVNCELFNETLPFQGQTCGCVVSVFLVVLKAFMLSRIKPCIYPCSL